MYLGNFDLIRLLRFLDLAVPLLGMAAAFALGWLIAWSRSG